VRYFEIKSTAVIVRHFAYVLGYPIPSHIPVAAFYGVVLLSLLVALQACGVIYAVKEGALCGYHVRVSIRPPAHPSE